MTRPGILTIAGLSLFTTALAAQASDMPCAEAVSTPCSVSGKLSLRHVCGPPWFCEKKGDKPRFTIYVIQLHSPVHIACIRDHDSDPVKDCGTTKEMQIYADDSVVTEARLRQLIGREVIATGITAEPLAPMDQTPGTMDLISFEPKPKPKVKAASH